MTHRDMMDRLAATHVTQASSCLVLCRRMDALVLGTGVRPMRRREFFAFLGGATAFLSPLAAQAQQPAPGKWRVGMLAPEIRQKPIREGLRELGYVEGQNLLIEWSYDYRVDRLCDLATEP